MARVRGAAAKVVGVDAMNAPSARVLGPAHSKHVLGPAPRTIDAAPVRFAVLGAGFAGGGAFGARA